MSVRLRSLRRARKASRKGARKAVTSIEFAAISLAFFGLVLIILETGMQLLVEGALDYGVRQVSRTGVTGALQGVSNQAIVTAVVAASGNFLNQANLSVALASYPQFGASGQPGANAGGPSNAVQYTLTYVQPFLTSFAANIIGRPALTHTVVFWVENEPFPSP